MFDEYEDIREGGDEATKEQLAQKICAALKVHTQIEEEIFYPAAREATSDNDLLDEAMVEHAGAKNLIAEIEAMDPADDLYDAKVRVLGEQIRHHVEEEEEELFPKSRTWTWTWPKMVSSSRRGRRRSPGKWLSRTVTFGIDMATYSVAVFKLTTSWYLACSTGRSAAPNMRG